MKRKHIAALIGLCLAALLLGACGRKDSAGGTAQAPSGSGGQSGSGVEVVAPDNSAGNTSQDAAVNDGNEDEADAAQEVDISNTYDIANQSGEAPVAEAANETTSGWEGTFSGGDGETLTLQPADEYSLSFSFAVSGISGTADLEGDYAVYHGDDDHDVSFSLSGNTVTVAVTLTEDGSAEESPINGTYTRNA